MDRDPPTDPPSGGAQGQGDASGPRLTWLGHASVVLEMGGLRVITDPALTPRVAHLRRHDEVELTVVRDPDLVLISHVHMDHLHLPSLRMLGRHVLVVVPTGAGSFLRRRGFRRVREIEAGRSMEIGRLTVEAVPARHSGRRGPHSRIAVEPLGYVCRADGSAVYFPGDTDLFPEMASLTGIDLALLPIGGWGPRVGQGHLDPVRAAQATELIHPGLVVPIHWGTFSPMGLRRGAPGWLRDPALRFRDEVARIGADDRLRLLDPGSGLSLPSEAGAR